MKRFLLLSVLFLAIPMTSFSDELPEVSKLPANPNLPDPLVMMDGTKVTTKEQWVEKRRPELKNLFQHYMYGFFPEALKIDAKVEREDPRALDGKATLKEITIRFGPAETPPIHLLLVVPNDRKGPAPCFVGMNFSGNHALLNDPKIHLPTVWMYPNRVGVKDNKATDDGRGSDVNVWALDQAVARGYAVATFYSGDIDPDRKDKREGIQPHLAKPDAKPGPHDWGTIAAWAWGIQRAVDYLVTDKDIDKAHIAVVGHSRLGKTALLAGAFDDRLALVIPHQAGCGGTAPSRTKETKVETVVKINTAFPHWFNGTFKEFNDDTSKLPFDQHCLAALCAPRPVLFSNADDDHWANPEGQFQMLQAADPVYRLLKAGGLEAKEVPPLGKLSDGTLGYYIRDGKHSMTREDWKVFLDYADRHFGK